MTLLFMAFNILHLFKCLWLRACRTLKSANTCNLPGNFAKRNLSKPNFSNLTHKILIYLYIIHLLKSSTCFKHYPAHLQEIHVITVYMQPLVLSLSASYCPVQFFLNRCTGQSPAESDDTRGCMWTWIS